MQVIEERVRFLNSKPVNSSGRYVLYWMQVYKRTENNHALKYAIDKANELDLPLVVYEGLKFYYPWASDRIHTFILEGVNEKRIAFKKLGIRYVFYLQSDRSSPKQTVARIAKDAALIVTDDFPCFIVPEHNFAVSQRADMSVAAVDSNGVIPMSRFEKEEYAAYTIRPKIKKMLPEYFVPFQESVIGKKEPDIEVDCPDTVFHDREIPDLITACDIDHTVPPSPLYRGGRKAGLERLNEFVGTILDQYHKTRNRPEVDGSSRLSHYLHFGFLSSLEIGLAVEKADVDEDAKSAFLEELIVRRELSYNMTRFNPNYESLDALHEWVQKTMNEHRDDERKYLYTEAQLENGETHDELWNAIQRELVQTGGVHNYVRMLWGKNIIAWTRSYEEAFRILVHLNNKYSLDGRNPNSYAGILWCFGKHDRAWMEREVFGKIRYMTSNSTGKKFNSKKYIQWTLECGQQQLF
jgi:deoxyribodipyrimidine photo-lyase